MASARDESESFLPFKEHGPEHDDVYENRVNFTQSRLLKTHRALFISQMVFLFLNIFFLVWNFKDRSGHGSCQSNSTESQRLYSPAQDAIQYTVERFSYNTESSPFTGEPRPEVDQAWAKLLESSFIKVSESELKRMNKTSIMIRDGSGYIGTLESMHLLHCVKRLYEFQHPEYYPQSQFADTFSFGHLDHCLDIIRQAIMCNAEPIINTYYWENSNEIESNATGFRKCTNWNAIEEWVEERAYHFEGRFFDDLIGADNNVRSLDLENLGE